ncbi:hypothetical protein NDI47_02470 [Microcoleus vaginatus GB1-A2]|uniref:hypothetical protein n=1 Tax=Microcoleus vaginatus TaxID=119532 RepID=UPI001687F9A6|nr:hypothetical protein [Microcoleus sp. FACHB-61]
MGGLEAHPTTNTTNKFVCGTGNMPVPGYKPTLQFINTQNKFDGGTGILPVPDAIVIFLGRRRSPPYNQ